VRHARIAAWVAAASFAALALPACPARAAGDDCAARLAWIDARLARTGHRARVWSWSWGLGLGALTVGSLALVPFVADEERPDWYVSGFTSAVGILPLMIAPLEVMHDATDLHARLAVLPADADRCALVADAERRLARDAEGEAAGRAWWNHALNVAVNGGAGLFLGLAYDRWQSGLVTAVVGTAIGEAMIFTQPVDSVEDERAYRAGAISSTVTPMTPLDAGIGGARGGERRFGLILTGSF
jgi:hypothetical protein